jgi:short-subunit dehydrogenase
VDAQAQRWRASYGPWALVAGASDGIGAAFARQLAAAGLDLVLLARREPLLRELAAELAAAYGVRTRCVVADLTAPGLLQCVCEATMELEIGLLVYNAGATHGAGSFHEQPLAAALALVELNCRTPVQLVHHLGTRMRERGRGGIVLLSSLASLSGGGLTAVYNATKSFDMILAEGLWHELKPAGVDAMCLLVGATRTPSMLSSRPQFADYPGIMDPAQVAREGLAFLGRGPVWVAGEHNRDIVRRLLPVPRVGQINALSAATASIYGRPVNTLAGEDF